MMKTYILIVIISIGALSSCAALDKLTQFEINYSVDVSIPASLGINIPFSIPTPGIKLNVKKKLENNNSHTKLIEQLYLKEMSLNVASSSSKTLSFLKDIDIYIKTDDLPKMKIAFKHDIPNSVGKFLNLDVVDQDLKDYLKSDDFIIFTEVTVDELFSNKVDLIIDMKFWVDAKILGV